ncbi:PREDICTED: MORC family CW-type zinc finger protein 1 [Gekko japonicus]|uniref:MORC family CW-type zinc finger protein 1 n=1 Tax=Gekko japonicus TaxID=146911 RepID=A0ABM1LA33_GEKJA|nr:PREDICTED: MORC family CW-type zinc finger protein 1 [Gekko japonicus]
MMSGVSCYRALCRAQLKLEYLHANSTTHDFLFGAIAELIDNSRDAGATRLDIFTVNNENLQGGFMLCFLDDGCGMTPREATDLVYFGRSSKRTVSGMIGHYGNGLKSGAMRIGKDFILFTKKESTMTCLLFSQTFCETEGLTEVIIPIPSWSSSIRKPVMDGPELSIICKYSPFKSEAELMKQFDAIYGERGTLVVIYNLKLMLSGEPELDIQTDEADILIAGEHENIPEQWSLRAYTALLYFEPRMRIFIQAKKVETKRLSYCFYRPRRYPYIVPLRQVATNEAKAAEMELNSARHVEKEAKDRQKHLQGSLLHEDSEVAECDAVGNDKRMRRKLKDRQRNLRKSKTLFIIFGINIQDRSRDGMLIFSNNRLIRMFEKVGLQKKLGSYLGAGAVGIVDLPLDVMEPTHNKQSFANVKQYNHLLKSMESYLVQYWKDVGISQKGEMFFWNDFGYQGAKWNEKPSDSIQYKRRRAVEIPDIVQCDICLKWRLLSLDTDINNEAHHEIWTCAENKCHVPEKLPSIPLGTFPPSSWSLNDKEKLLVDSIKQCQTKMKNLPLQKCYLLQPHTVVQHTEDSTRVKDVLPFKVQDEEPLNKELEVIKIETDSESEAICIIISDNESEDLPKYEECKDCGFIHKGGNKQMQCDKKTHIQLDLMSCVTPEKKDLCRTDSISSSTEGSKKGDKEQALVGIEDFNVAVPHRQAPSQRSLENKMIETLTDHIKEFLLYFLPKCSYSREYLTSMSTEDILSMFKLKGQSGLNENVPLEIHQFRGHPQFRGEEKNRMVECKMPRGFLYVFQYFLQYKRQRLEEIQPVNQPDLERIPTIETKIGLCESQVKTEQERLNHLREKMAQLLLKIHPHLAINLEDIDGYLEKILNEELLRFV